MYKYYNQLIKNEFLNNCVVSDSIKVIYDDIFKKTKLFEESKNKDIFEMSVDEYIEMLKCYEGQSKSTIGVTLSKLLIYIDYCIPKYTKFNILRAIPKQLIIDELDAQDNFLFDTIQFEEYKTKIINSINGEYYLSMFICPYYGILGKSFKEMINLSIDNIDKHNSEISLYNDRKVKIDDEVISILFKTSNIKTLFLGGRNGNQNEVDLTIFKNPNQIFKFIDKGSTRSYEQRAQANFNRFFSYHLKNITNEKRLSLRSIYRSGLINYLNEEAKLKKYSLKDDILNNSEHNLFYKQCLLQFGSNMTWASFKFNYKDWIIINL